MNGKYMLSLKILLVEDDKINSKLISRLLEMTGFDVLTAFDGREAVAAVRNGSFDAILMDIEMPLMNGYEACMSIREFAPEVPVISISSDHAGDVIEKCYESGMDGFINKNSTPGEYLNKITNIIINKKNVCGLLKGLDIKTLVNKMK